MNNDNDIRAYCRISSDHVLDLAKLNTQSAQFHLIVHSSVEVYFTVFADTHEVTAAVCGLSEQFCEILFVQIIASDVSASDSVTHDDEFSHCAERLETSVSVNGSHCDICKRSADRYVI